MAMELIDAYLEEQRGLTAVEKFALQHDQRKIPQDVPIYQDLIPKTTPGPGQQYAFAVDLDRCTGCKACVAACHSENGLDEDESWRSVGLLQGGSNIPATSSRNVDDQQPVIQHVTASCHHCLEPGCLTGCPVNAYEKDPATGIVKHLEDQCIGCQYCTLTCPYDVPQYNKKRGIVHKCDMCISRLQAHEAPACVRACPNGAIQITLVEAASVRENPAEYVNVPEAPDSRHTLPTTRYLTRKRFPQDMTSLDFYAVKPQHSHWPLIVMLVLTQLSVGAFWVTGFLQHSLSPSLREALVPYQVLVSLGIGILALGVSIFHLGRPRYALRAVIGLRRSWLSREIVAFGVFSFLVTVMAFSEGMEPFRNFLAQPFKDLLGLSTALIGALGVFSSFMVYKVTRRPFWDHPWTLIKFLLTSGILGISTILFSTIFLLHLQSLEATAEIMKEFGEGFCWALMGLTGLKLILETAIFLHLGDGKSSSFKKTALLMTRVFQSVTLNRFLLGISGGVLGPLFLLTFREGMSYPVVCGVSSAVFLLTLGGEFLERYLFFRAVVPLKMSGG